MELSLLHRGGLVHSKDPHHLTSLWERVEKHSSYLEVWRLRLRLEGWRNLPVRGEGKALGKGAACRGPGDGEGGSHRVHCGCRSAWGRGAPLRPSGSQMFTCRTPTTSKSPHPKTQACWGGSGGGGAHVSVGMCVCVCVCTCTHMYVHSTISVM